MITFPLVILIIEWAIRAGMLITIMARPGRPATALAWLAVTMLIPWLGLILYLMIGNNRLGSRRARRYSKKIHLSSLSSAPGINRTFVTSPKIDEHRRSLVVVAETLVGMPILGGNRVDLFPKAAEFINALIQDIDKAAHHVHMVYFIYENDDQGRRVADALIRASKRGVKCRVMADAAGSFFFFSELGETLTQNGVEVPANLPVTNLRRLFRRIDLRNHRKLTVIDGAIAYTGSHNIVRADYGNPRLGQRQDLTARIVGPTVNQLQAVFLEDWEFEVENELPTDGLFPTPTTPEMVPIQVVPSGPNQPNAPMRDVIIEALHSARRLVVITTPYFVPDEALTTALRLAAARGVKVQLVLPKVSDHAVTDLAARAYFDQLLDAGVHILLNRAGMLHAKTMTVDNCFAMVGSANFDIRSFFLNFELNLLLFEVDATDKLRICQSRYIADSEEVTLEHWRRRRVWTRLAQNLAMLFSPLL